MSLPIGGSSKLSTCTEEVSDSDLLMTSPRIGKSFCSRIAKSSPPQLTHGGGVDEVDEQLPAPSETSYVAGDPVDLPTLSPPPYKANSTSGGSTSSVCGTGSAGGRFCLLLDVLILEFLKKWEWSFSVIFRSCSKQKWCVPCVSLSLN